MQAATGTLPLQLTVKMKGLPFRASHEDIIRFFGVGFSLRESSVYLRRHADGRPLGEAFVLFETQEEARRATQKDRETFGDKFGDRYVRVYPSLESDAQEIAVAVLQQATSFHQSNGHSQLDSVVKIKSLPFDANQLDIIQFFATFKLKPNGVQLVVRADNKPTGEAFVDFENAEEAGRAIRERDHKVFSEKFGDRYVRLIQVSRKEMQATLALRFGGEGILKMKGIPFKAGANDVRKFFAGYKIKPDGVSFIMHADGRPTGMAFIEFETPQEAVRAMEKDRAKFGPEYGDRFCMLQLVGRHEMDKVQLQREADIAPKQLLNGMNVLQAALASQALAQNSSLQPLLMAQAAAAGGAAWLNGSLNPALAHLGLLNSGGGLPNGPLGSSSLQGATSLTGGLPQLPVAPSPVSPVPPVGTVPSSSSSSMQFDATTLAAAQLGMDAAGAAAGNPLLMYGHQAAAAAAAAANGEWGRPPQDGRMALAAGLGMGSWTPDQLAVAARHSARNVYGNGGGL